MARKPEDGSWYCLESRPEPPLPLKSVGRRFGRHFKGGLHSNVATTGAWSLVPTLGWTTQLMARRASDRLART